jgi:L-serine/L-threonine ammonia-lyase
MDLLLLTFFCMLSLALLTSPVSSLSSYLKMSSVASEARAKKLFRQTPLIRSDPLSRLAGTPVYLKLDVLQNSGSFKDRGMAHLCLELSKKGVTNIISSSGGNAGLAAATVAQQLGLHCTVVVPVTTKQLVVEKLESLGATVQVTGENWNAADAVVKKMVAEDTSTAYIPPYENPLLWTGHSTVIDEIYQELDDAPSTIIVSVGGGGLLCGVLEGLDRLNAKCNVIAAETDGASSFAQAWNSGELVTLAGIDSVATSLGALQVSESAIERSKSHESKSLGTVTTAICSDAEAVDACLQFARDHRLLVEPACGAALAVLYSDRLRKNVGEQGPIVVEVCGGSGVNLDLLQQWKEMLSL